MSQLAFRNIMAVTVGPLVVLLLFVGCTNFKETYYVGMFDSGPDTRPTTSPIDPNQPNPTQFYRYTISGWSLFSKTEFAAGLYDARAVDRLFGEVRKARSPKPVGGSAGASAGPGATMPVQTGIAALYLDDRMDAPNVATTAPSKSLTVIGAVLSFGAEPPTVSLKNVTQIRARLVIKSSYSRQVDGSYAATQPSQISIENITKVVLGGPGDANQQIPLTLAEIGGNVTCQKPGAFVVAGGKMLIVTSDAKQQAGPWAGTNDYASTESDYDRLVSKGGNFTVHGGVVEESDGAIRVQNAITEFQGCDELIAEKGATLRVVDGKATLRGRITVTPTKAVDPQTLSPTGKFEEFQVEVNGKPQILQDYMKAIATNAKWEGSMNYLLPDVVLSKTQNEAFEIDAESPPAAAETSTSSSVSNDAKLVVASQPRSQPAVSVVTAAKLEVDSIGITEGTIHLTTSAAVSSAVAAGKAPELNLVADDHGRDGNLRHILVRFGPEGTAISQSDSERMVVFMSADPQALTDRIGAMVKAQQTQGTIAAVIAQPRAAEQNQAIQNAQSDVKTSAAAANAFLNAVNTTQSSDTVKTLTNQFIESLDSGD